MYMLQCLPFGDRNGTVFLCANQAGHTLDIHKTAVITDQVFPENLLTDLEIAFHSGNE